MADPTQQPPADPQNPGNEAAAQPAPTGERDVLFALQVAITDFIEANWKVLGYLVAAVLVGALVYGGWDFYQTTQKNEKFSAIARVDHKMPKPDPLSQMGLGPADDPADAGRMKDLETGAKLYEDIARDSSGAAAVLAWNRAADAWKRAGKEAERMTALEQATKASNDPALVYATQMRLAATLLEGVGLEGAGSENQSKALAIYQQVATSLTGFYGQQAWVTLIQTQVSMNRKEEAQGSYKLLKEKFPNSVTPELDVLFAAPPAGGS